MDADPLTNKCPHCARPLAQHQMRCACSDPSRYHIKIDYSYSHPLWVVTWQGKVVESGYGELIQWSLTV